MVLFLSFLQLSFRYFLSASQQLGEALSLSLSHTQAHAQNTQFYTNKTNLYNRLFGCVCVCTKVYFISLFFFVWTWMVIRGGAHLSM